MSKFCKFCGAPLEDNTPCTCPRALEELAAQQQAAVTAPSTEAPEQAEPQPAAASVPTAEVPQQTTGQPAAAYSPPVPPYAPQGAYQQPPAPQSVYQPQAAYQAPPAPPIRTEPSAARMTLANIFPFLKAYIHSTDATTKAAVQQNDIGLAVSFAVIFALSVFTFVYTLIIRFADVAKELIIGLTDKLPIFGGNSLDPSMLRGVKISLPFFESFLYCLLCSAVIVLCTTLVAFILPKLMKASISFKSAFIAGSVNLIFPTLVLLAAALLLFLSPKLGLCMFLLAVLTWCIAQYSAAKALTSPASSGAFVAGAVAAIFIVLALTSYTGYKTFGAVAQNMEINETSIGDVLGGFEDLIDEIPYNIFG